MPTTTLDAPMPTTVHQPAPIELWLANQPAEPEPCMGSPRSPEAVEVDPENAHATSGNAAY